MSKILSTLAILCLVSVASATDTVTSQSGLVSSSLAGTAVQVFSGINTTEWASTPTPWYSVSSSSLQNVKFGPSATSNETIFAYGVIYTSDSTEITKVVRRELNATIILDGTTSPIDYAVIVDVSFTVAIPAGSTSYLTAVGLGYLAILSTGSVNGNPGVQVTLIPASGTSSIGPTLVSANAAADSFTLGDIWYDIGSGAFFFTYAVTDTDTNIYVGGILPSGSLYWTAPGLAILSTATADTITGSIVSGPNNWLNSTEIIVVYKDSSATTPTTYFSIITKSTSTTAAGTATMLVADVTSGTTLTYVPIGVWASEYTYGISTSLVTTPSGGSATYSIENFFNVTTSDVTNTKDSGLTNGTAAATKVVGWPLTTGYSLLGYYAGTEDSAELSTVTTYFGSFYANGSANTTVGMASLTSSLAGPFNIFTDLNGTTWIGWTDIDATVGNIYNLYVARFQSQIYSSASGNALTTLMAFVAFCLVAVFAF